MYANFCGGCGRKLPVPGKVAGEEDKAWPPAKTETAQDGVRRQITVMFCDLVESTTLSTSLDPEDLREVIRAFQAAAAAATERHAGFIARYMGDGILVYFGYPQAHEDDAERAVRTGLELMAAVHRLRPLPGVALDARVGIATGLVVVGDLIGEGMSREEAVVGPTPYLAARLQGLAKPGTVVMSQATRRLVVNLFDCEHLGRHHLKGFREPVHAWRVLDERAVASRFEAIHPATELTPLVGRAPELQALEDAWSSARQGRGQVVAVRGDPGVGKSRLTQALREHVAKGPHVLLRYYCAPRFQNTALFPIIDQLQRVARLRQDDSVEVRLDKLERLLARSDSGQEMSQTVPYLAALLSIPLGNRYVPISMTPERQKERTLKALAGQLIGIARNKPVLVLFEDLHWIDASSLEWLEQLIAPIPDCAVLLLVTSRPEFEPPWAGVPFATTLELGRLNQGDSRKIIASLTGGKSLPPQVIGQVLEKSDGVPLFVEEIAKAVLESGLMEEESARYVLTGALPTFAVPSTLHDSLMARLDRLDATREVAQAGAAIGRHFSLDLLAAVCELPEQELRSAIQRLADANIIECRGSYPDATCSFKHALLQDAAHATMLRGRRQHLHRQIANALENGFPQTVAAAPELLAHHFTEARVPEKAIPYWQQAGVLASSRAAHTEAIGHFLTAIDLLTHLSACATRDQLELGVRLNLGLSLSAARGYTAPEVEDAYRRARDLCHRLGDTADLYPVLRGLCTFYIVRGELSAARELAEQCLRLGDQTLSPEYLIEGYTALGYTLVYMGEISKGQTLLEKGLDAYRTHGGQGLQYPTEQDPAVSDLSLLALVAWMRGDTEAGLRWSREAIAHAEELKRPFDLAYAHCFAAMYHNMSREPKTAADHAARAIDLSMEHGFDAWLAAGTLHSAVARGALGETAEAIGLLKTTLAAWEAAGAGLNRPFFEAGLAETYRRDGQHDAALTAVGQAIDHAERHREHFYDAVLYRLRGEIRIARGGDLIEAGERDLLYALEIARGQGSRLFELDVLASLHVWYRKSGRPDPSQQAFQSLCDTLSQRSPDAVPVREARALLASNGSAD